MVRSGLIIGIISPGYVPTKWMMHMRQVERNLPTGLTYRYAHSDGDFSDPRDKDKSYASLRDSVVRYARNTDTKWLMFIDTDVFLPKDTISRLMKHNKDIVTGVYFTKSELPQPVVYKEWGDGPFWGIEEQKELIEVSSAGLGCTLINLEVFDKFEEAGIPFFKQGWSFIREDGYENHIPGGEDLYFFFHARKLGFKVYCDPTILCDHYDWKNDKFYPGEN